MCSKIFFIILLKVDSSTLRAISISELAFAVPLVLLPCMATSSLRWPSFSRKNFENSSNCNLVNPCDIFSFLTPILKILLIDRISFANLKDFKIHKKSRYFTICFLFIIHILLLNIVCTNKVGLHRNYIDIYMYPFQCNKINLNYFFLFRNNHKILYRLLLQYQILDLL